MIIVFKISFSTSVFHWWFMLEQTAKWKMITENPTRS